MIYLTFLSTNCVKIHQIPYVIFEKYIPSAKTLYTDDLSNIPFN